MSLPKFVPVAHMGHDAPWLQIRTVAEVRERRAYIKTNKPEHERPLRLKLLKTVKEPLPTKLAKAYAAWTEVYAAWVKADAARAEVDAALVKASAAWVKADAAWGRAIVSREGVAFHKKVCGCSWTPKKPDILLQLAT